MTTVWVVLYSDYDGASVDGVFFTKESAERYIATEEAKSPAPPSNALGVVECVVQN